MSMKKILNLIKRLSKNYGEWNRLLLYIQSLNKTEYNKLKISWENMNFKSEIEFISYVHYIVFKEA